MDWEDDMEESVDADISGGEGEKPDWLSEFEEWRFGSFMRTAEEDFAMNRIIIEDGLMYDENGCLIGELPIEDPNPFLDPVNYISGFIAGWYKTGAEITFGRNFRLAPFGNRTGHPYGELPHYHRGGPRLPDGSRAPGQGMRRHRPWEGW